MESRFPLIMACLVAVALAATWLLVPARTVRDVPTFRGRVPHGDTLRFRKCGRDDECTVVRNGCCDCNNGLEEISVRRDMATAFGRAFTCSGICPEMGGPGCPPGEPKCIDNLCTFVSPERDRREKYLRQHTGPVL